MNRTQSLYRKAKKIIPGGTQLLSKRPEMFLPDKWPAYYSRAKGCEVWDLDGRHYYDASLMGVGANILGYAFDEVDDAAREAIADGSMCTLNAPEEVYLAEKLCSLHPWAQSVRYAKAGGEAMAQATRIARAHTKKDIVLCCGYHGWHDWYLSANLTKGDPLAEVHLKGLLPLGVPRGMAGTNLIFHYNNFEEFLQVAEENKEKIAAVIMEPIRNHWPKDNFLQKIREYTEQKGIVLIMDEISSGFRLCAGGSHLKLDVTPDMAVFAKAMTNGYPLSAIIGKAEVMEAAQSTFISSTFFTERIGLAASLRTIECYEKYNVSEYINVTGKTIQEKWWELAKKHGVEIVVSGIYPLSHFEFVAENPLVYKTFFTEEMLKRGFLAATGFYVSSAHTEEMLEKYFDAVDEVFGRISQIEGSGEKIEDHVDAVCQSGFERLGN